MRSMWKSMPIAGRVALVVGILVAATMVVVAARRDLAERDPATVRGDPDIWRRATYMPGAAAAYLMAGRRHRPSRPTAQSE
jgi:hypothetical protein